MSDVQTALKYIYAGYPLHHCRHRKIASCPRIRSTADAKALITFAHKYTCTSLLKACEAYLVGLAQEDMSELAEACHLDTLLAHCELSMVRDRDELLWRHPALTSAKISHSCLLRMLRASQRALQKSSVDIAMLKTWKAEMP